MSLRIKPLLFMLISALVLLIAVPLVYFTILRVPDTEFSAVSERISNMEKSREALGAAASKIKNAADITDEAVTTIETETNNYNDNFEVISNSLVIRQNSGVREVFDKEKTPLANFGLSARDLSDSLKKYRMILSFCTNLADKIERITTAVQFDSEAKECSTAIEDAKTASYAALNTEYLNDYQTLSTDLLKGYKQLAISRAGTPDRTQAVDNILRAKGEIVAISRNTLDLSLAPSPQESIKRLQDVIELQKSKLIR